MTGRLPGLSRRGAVYTVRLQVPSDLQHRLSVVEVRRSLFTKNIDVARRRCLDAVRWFGTLMARLRVDATASGATLEDAVKTYFARLSADLDQPRLSPDYAPEDSLALTRDMADDEIESLEHQLRSNEFEPYIRTTAAELLASVTGVEGQYDERLNLLARQLVARAQRQYRRRLKHAVSNPWVSFKADDPLFEDDPDTQLASPSRVEVIETLPLVASNCSVYPTLSQIIDLYRSEQIKLGVGPSQVEEVARACRWLMEEVGADTSIDRITSDQARQFRDNLRRLDRTLRGTGTVPFKARLTDLTDRQIRSDTAQRYWNSVRRLFAYAFSEGKAPSDPTIGIVIPRHRDEPSLPPNPFTHAELRSLFETSLYSGRKSKTHRMVPGDYRRRDAHWWAALVLLFTGLRGAELSQLFPSDFVFDHDVPHLKVRREDETGETVKRTKNRNSIRDVPLAPTLLLLGFREFVQRRAKYAPQKRVFEAFRSGTGAKLSEGMSRFFADYLRRFDLHAPGRGEHAFRHTTVELLLEAGLLDEQIAATIGHSRGQTGRYGRQQYPLARKAEIISQIKFSFDLIELLGGPYSAKEHQA